MSSQPLYLRDKFPALFTDSNLRRLFALLAERNIKILNPMLTPSGFTYPEVEEVLGLTGEAAVIFLEKLAAQGILRSRLVDQILRCPYCNSYRISVRMRCPFCNSLNIEKSVLIEHFVCGALRRRTEFFHEGKLICPQCGMELKEINKDYRYAGTWFECHDCNKQSDEPEVRYYCRDCDMEHTMEEILLERLYAYHVPDEIFEALRREHLQITPIASVLAEFGYQVNSPGQLKGKSGVFHVYDIVGVMSANNPRTVAIDVVQSESEVGEQAVINMFAKALDTSPTNTILVAIPKAADTTRNLALIYKITLIEGGSAKEAAEKLREFLK